MIRFELEDIEADYVVKLLLQRPLGEALGLYRKLELQVQQQAMQGQQLTGAVSPANGLASTEAAPTH